MRGIEKNVEKHLLEENKVYIVVNGQLECIDIPETGFGSVTIEWKYAQIQTVTPKMVMARSYFEKKHENHNK